MRRRGFTSGLVGVSALTLVKDWVSRAAPSGGSPQVGLCTFSCQHLWKQVRQGAEDLPFSDARGFYDYARSLGGEGVQTRLSGLDLEQAEAFGAHVRQTEGYYEGDVRLPRTEQDLAKFEQELTLAKAAGARCVRIILLGGRRYESFSSLAEFESFREEGIRRLKLALPLAKQHALPLAWENHKDFTVKEQLELLGRFHDQGFSDVLGILVDTGNNIAMCEDPHEVIEALAPFALSCHLKDMAVQPAANGFLLSEVPFGTGFLDLPHIVRSLVKANPEIRFHVEMATRDPLSVPCQSEGYWAVFPTRREADLQRTMAMVEANPLKQSPPRVSGLENDALLAAEEANNRACLEYRARLTG